MTQAVIHFHCPHCGRGLKAPGRVHEVHKSCPACHHSLDVPAVSRGAHRERNGHRRPPPLPPPSTRVWTPARKAGLLATVGLGLFLVAVALWFGLRRPAVQAPGAGGEHANAPAVEGKREGDKASDAPALPATETRPAEPDRTKGDTASTTPAPAPVPVPVPTGEVLVPGDPPLMKEALDRTRTMMEWILDVRMTVEQRREYERLFVKEWNKKDKAGKVAGLAIHAQHREWWDKVQKMSTPEQERERSIVANNLVKGLLKSPDEDDQLLIELCKAAHKELIHLGQGHVYLAEGAADKAIGEYTEAIRIDSKLALAFAYRGCAYFNKQHHDPAIQDLTEAIRLDRDLAPAYIFRAAAYREKRDYDKVIEDLSVAIRLNPPDLAGLHNGRGDAYRLKGASELAIADYTEAIRHNPKFFDAWNSRGLVYLEGKKDFDKAIEDFSEAIRHNPKDAVLFYNRGVAYQNKKDYDRAIADYDEALRLDPKFEKARADRNLALEQVNAKPGTDTPATALTIEKVNALVHKYAGQTVVFRNVRMSGKLDKEGLRHYIFFLSVLSPEGNWYTRWGKIEGNLAFVILPEMADKLADEKLATNLTYSVNLTGRIDIGKITSMSDSKSWAHFVNQIDFLDRDGKVIKTLKTELPVFK